MSDPNYENEWMPDDEQWLEDGDLEGEPEPHKTFASFCKADDDATPEQWHYYRKEHWGEKEWEDFYDSVYEDESFEEYWQRMEDIDFL